MQAPEENSGNAKPEYDVVPPAADKPLAIIPPIPAIPADPVSIPVHHQHHADPTADTVAATGQPEAHLAHQAQPVPDVDVEAVVGEAVENVVTPLHPPSLHPQDSNVQQEPQENIVQQHHHHTMPQVEPPATHPLGAADPGLSTEPQADHPQISQDNVQMTMNEMSQGQEPGQAPPPSSPVQHPHHEQLPNLHHAAVAASAEPIAHPDSHGVSMSVGLPPVSVASAAVGAGVPATIATSATATPVVSSMGVIHASSTTPSNNTSKMMTNNNINMPIPVLAPAPAAPSPHASATVPSLSHGMQIFAPQHMHTQNHSVQQQHHHMDLHENGNLLQFGATTTEDVTMANVNVNVSVGAGIGGIGANVGNVGNVGQTINSTYAVNGAVTNQPVRVIPSTGDVGLGGSHHDHGQHSNPRKTQRLPGTKQCPSCQSTIAAALAQCNKCGHVFRAKKEKPKRSGKRGKKNCPKCGYENPSACSSCKKCKYVFRLKLMDRYKQMRPRDNTETGGNGTVNVNVNNGMSNLVNVHPGGVPGGIQGQVTQVQVQNNGTAAAAAVVAREAAAAAASVVPGVGVSGGLNAPSTIAGVVSSSGVGIVTSASVPPLPTNSTGSLPMGVGVQQYHALTQTNAGYTHVAPLNPMPQSIQGNGTVMSSTVTALGQSSLPMTRETVTSMHAHTQPTHNNPHAQI